MSALSDFLKQKKLQAQSAPFRQSKEFATSTVRERFLGNTGLGPDGILQPNRPTHALNARGHTALLDEGEDVFQKSNGDLRVMPALESRGGPTIPPNAPQSELMKLKEAEKTQSFACGGNIKSFRGGGTIKSYQEGGNVPGVGEQQFKSIKDMVRGGTPMNVIQGTFKNLSPTQINTLSGLKPQGQQTFTRAKNVRDPQTGQVSTTILPPLQAPGTGVSQEQLTSIKEMLSGGTPKDVIRKTFPNLSNEQLTSLGIEMPAPPVQQVTPDIAPERQAFTNIMDTIKNLTPGQTNNIGDISTFGQNNRAAILNSIPANTIFTMDGQQRIKNEEGRIVPFEGDVDVFDKFKKDDEEVTTVTDDFGGPVETVDDEVVTKDDTSMQTRLLTASLNQLASIMRGGSPAAQAETQRILDDLKATFGTEQAVQAQQMLQQGVAPEVAAARMAISGAQARGALGQAAAQLGIERLRAQERAAGDLATQSRLAEAQRFTKQQYDDAEFQRIADDVADGMSFEAANAKYGIERADYDRISRAFERGEEVAEIELEGMKVKLGDIEFNSAMDMINNNATFEQVNARYPNITEDEYNAMRTDKKFQLDFKLNNLTQAKNNTLFDMINNNMPLSVIQNTFPEITEDDYNTLRTDKDMLIKGATLTLNAQEMDNLTSAISRGVSYDLLKQDYPGLTINQYNAMAEDRDLRLRGLLSDLQNDELVTITNMMKNGATWDNIISAFPGIQNRFTLGMYNQMKRDYLDSKELEDKLNDIHVENAEIALGANRHAEMMNKIRSGATFTSIREEYGIDFNEYRALQKDTKLNQKLKEANVTSADIANEADRLNIGIAEYKSSWDLAGKGFDAGEIKDATGVFLDDQQYNAIYDTTPMGQIDYGRKVNIVDTMLSAGGEENINNAATIMTDLASNAGFDFDVNFNNAITAEKKDKWLNSMDSLTNLMATPGIDAATAYNMMKNAGDLDGLGLSRNEFVGTKTKTGFFDAMKYANSDQGKILETYPDSMIKEFFPGADPQKWRNDMYLASTFGAFDVVDGNLVPNMDVINNLFGEGTNLTGIFGTEGVEELEDLPEDLPEEKTTQDLWVEFNKTQELLPEDAQVSFSDWKNLGQPKAFDEIPEARETKEKQIGEIPTVTSIPGIKDENDFTANTRSSLQRVAQPGKDLLDDFYVTWHNPNIYTMEGDYKDKEQNTISNYAAMKPSVKSYFDKNVGNSINIGDKEFVIVGTSAKNKVKQDTVAGQTVPLFADVVILRDPETNKNFNYSFGVQQTLQDRKSKAESRKFDKRNELPV